MTTTEITMHKIIEENDKEFKMEEDRLNRIISLWKDFYYEFHDLMEKDRIFSKLPHLMGGRLWLYTRKYANSSEHILNLFKNFSIIPALVFWKFFLIKSEQLYYARKYPEVVLLENIKDKDFDYLFVLNTRDHVITALPVLENIDKMGKILVITFKEVYSKYMEDFNKLENAKILLFEYELKNLPIKKYVEILSESKNKFKTLKSYKMDADVKKIIKIDSNFVKFHLKEELIQYHYFKKVFSSFNLKGVVSIVFTTAFELCREREIPTFILQHGIGGKWHGLPYVSDYWFTLDDISKDSLDEWLDHTVEVLPLGSPRFEYLKKVALSKRDISKFNEKVGYPEYKRNVTYISISTAMHENGKLLSTLKKLREKLTKDTNFIIKLHPRGKYNIKREIEKIFPKEELKRTVFIKKEMDFYEIIANSDVIITTLSTGMLESIAMDIPTLQVNFTGQPYPREYDLSSFGWKEPINDPNILINETLSILNDTKRHDEVIEKQRWLKNRMLTNFGNSGEIIAKTIVDICNKNK